MNENIKELARRCNFTEQDIENMSPGFEKFAELIVQECINTIEKSDAECSDEWDYVERNLSALIKEHFGGKIA